MNFVLAKEYRFWWTVKVNVPSEDKPDEHEEKSFKAHFVAIDKEEAERLDALQQALTTDEERREHEHALIKRVMIDWRDVDGPGEKPKPVEYSPEALDQMLGFAFVRAGIYRAYFEALAGRALEKN